MTIVISISRFTPTVLAYLLFFSAVAAINVTTILSSFPDLSSFAALLSSSGVSAELSGRNSLTLLAVPNSHLSFASVNLTRRLPPALLADLLGHHVLLQFFTDSDLRRIPPSGSTVTTLYEALGRSYLGSVNVTRNPVTSTVTIGSPNSSNITVLKLLKTIGPNVITILTVDSLLIPTGSDLTASESFTPPPSAAATLPSAAGINITQVLINGHNFNVAISMLIASGVITDFENDERGAGITVFVPTDTAFSDLPSDLKLQSLPAEQKAVVLKFHVLHSYYTLGSLESITNPVQPTLATEEMGAGSYTLSISRVNDSGITIDSGMVKAHWTQTVFDQNPVSVFGISKVLLPKELFDRSSDLGRPGRSSGASPPQEISLSPERSSGLDSPPSRLLSPPDDINYGDVQRTCFMLHSLFSLYVGLVLWL